ncbi:MAG: ABC transporter substrate-binding protein [Candidatus Bathyarchaeota archaeon]|nr:ABC transporter substrate-binding protein [Candidatus Bathyarchaeota archaeon]
MIYVGLDDTDILVSRGTGRLARDVAAALSARFGVFGVTRHQLFVHPDVPFTSHNSCAVIHVEAPQSAVEAVFGLVRRLMLEDFIVGSDPGLAVAFAGQVVPAVVAFGQDAKSVVVSQERALQVAGGCGIRLEGLGGTNGGVIGALAGVGLASLGCDGRFLLRGKNRDLTGDCSVQEVLSSGVDVVMTLQGKQLSEGTVRVPKHATPSFIGGKAVLFVAEVEDGYEALKRA